MIAGVNDDLIRLNDVEHVSIANNNNLCNPMDLDYTVLGHASVATDLGILTCGGRPNLQGFTSKCTLPTHEGQTTSFPPMRRVRGEFGLGIVNDTVFAVSGYPSYTTMEKIDYKTDSEWTLTDLPFGVRSPCLTTTTSSLVITGGYNSASMEPDTSDHKVSKIILCFVIEDKKIFVFLDILVK